jgi:ABC-type Mn2+/Zn2+ transport system permease subunit
MNFASYLELLSLFSGTLVVATLAGLCLPVFGAISATQREATLALCLSQACGLGILLGLLISEQITSHVWVSEIPTLTGAAVGYLTLRWTGKIFPSSPAVEVWHLVLFALLAAATHVLGGLAPHLEIHLTQMYLGDLVTLTQRELIFVSVALGFASLLMWVNRNAYVQRAFFQAIFGNEPMGVHPKPKALGFHPAFILVLCVSVQWMGLMYTLALLYLPTVFLRFSRTAGLWRHLKLCCMLGVSGSLLGFMLSLGLPTLPTVPVMIVTLATVSWGAIRMQARG